eukprot:COSAG06_NODE_11706_length_1475_cov_1.174419_3_plen_20_part_01
MPMLTMMEPIYVPGKRRLFL